MSPTWPEPVSTPSYRRCAVDIVRRGEKPSLRLASCCSVLVVNGGDGLVFLLVTATLATRGWSPRSASACAVAAGPSPIPGLAPSIRTSSAANRSPASVCSSASSVQYSRAVKARISRSRSTTMRVATDCTRPAERPPRTLRDSNGLRV